MMNISVIGAGYVGLISGIGFAKLNNKVSIIDINPTLIENLKNKQLPFYEPDLKNLINDKLVTENIDYFTEYNLGINELTEIVFVCVQTPTDSETGKTDVTFLKSVLQNLKKLENYKFNICIKSTVRSSLAKEICVEIGIDFNKVIFNPEFLREGSAFDDFFNPDRIVIGGYNKEVIQKCLDLYKDFECEKVSTDPESSQMIKYLSNSYLAMRLSFVNEAYRLADENSANPVEVLKAIGLDERIGSHYFRPSPGWGGSCFPKDVKELVNSYQSKHDLPLLSNIVKSNELQMDWFTENLLKIAQKENINQIVLIGAAFKENTDDLRESPTLKIYKRLETKDIDIVIYDKNINLNEEYISISKLEDLKENSAYVEMFPDSSEEREILLSKIKSLNNTFLFKIWEST